MEVLESPGKVLDFFVSKRVGTLSLGTRFPAQKSITTQLLSVVSGEQIRGDVLFMLTSHFCFSLFLVFVYFFATSILNRTTWMSA